MKAVRRKTQKPVLTKFKKAPKYPHHRSDATHPKRGHKRMLQAARKRA